MQEGKVVAEKALQIAEERREVKGKGETGIYTQPCRVPQNSKES